MKNLLEVKNLSVSFGSDKVIKNLSFSVPEGDFLTILGPNGSGKTVLLKTILGLINNYEGEVSWAANVRTGYLPQGLTQMKVGGLPLNVSEFLALKEKNRDKTWEILETVGIKDDAFLKKRIGDLSGGQFQRMLLAWALLDDPKILIFDEPTTGIDVGGEETVYNLLKKLNQEKGITIILITHDVNIVYKYSKNVLCMSKDNVCNSRPEEILNPEKLKEIYGMPVKFYKHKH